MNALRWCRVLALFAITGCGFGSVSPIIPDDAAKADPKLIGTWRDSSSQEGAVISWDGTTGYKILYTENNGKTAHFLAKLGTVGTRRVLDVSPDELPDDISDLYKGLLLPLHTPVFIDSVGTVLRFRMIDADSVKPYFTRNPRAAAFVKHEDT